MIELEEVKTEELQTFWDAHIRYLIDDGIVSDEEDLAYFSGDKYRGILLAHRERAVDTHRLVWFCENRRRIGAASYCIYQSEDGKCFILDFWVFPAFRGNGTGHRCFAALEQQTRKDGALFYELNSEKPDSVRFWKSLDFTENGVDEYGMPLFIRRFDTNYTRLKWTEDGMKLTIKQMETDEEIRGKAFVHWTGWHTAYTGLVSAAYLDKLTLAKCEELAYRWRDNILVAKDGERVVGFVGYGTRDDAPDFGEVFALYVLPAYWGTGVAQALMDAALHELGAYQAIRLWVLRDNPRAIRFYEKCGFRADGAELYSKNVDATEIRMVKRK